MDFRMLKKIMTAAALMAMTACGGTLIVPITNAGTLGFANGSSQITAPAVTVDDVNFGSMLNNLRITNGVGTVSYDSRLDDAAQAHAEDMVTNNYFDHLSQDGRTALDRIKAAGYRPVIYGENIAGRQQTDSEVLNAWNNSPDHNAVLNTAGFEDFALGVAGEGSSTRWVLLLASE
jgi:uncharacterized protein YkwD